MRLRFPCARSRESTTSSSAERSIETVRDDAECSLTCEANMKLLSLLLAVLLQAPTPALTGKAYRFEKIAEGVYYATATGSMVTGSKNAATVRSADELGVAKT